MDVASRPPCYEPACRSSRNPCVAGRYARARGVCRAEVMMAGHWWESAVRRDMPLVSSPDLRF